jgi:hypothetical protein
MKSDRRPWLALLALAAFTLLSPGAAFAQSPSSIAGRTIQLTISSGSSPFASSGSYRFLPSALDSSYAIVPISGAIAASTGTHSYTKTGTTTATLSMTDSVAGSLTAACTFTTASSGTYVLTGTFGGSQSGTFTLYSAASPASIAGYTITVSITSGASPFATSGSYQFLPASSGSAYNIVRISGSVADSSGTYAYTQNSATTGYIAYDDSLVGTGYTAQLSFNTATSGTVYLRKAGSSGYQTGTFTMTPPPANVAPTISIQPQGRTTNAGASVTFSVTASGTPAPSYQWRRDGTNLAGATSASHTIASAQVSHAGTYTVFISNAAGSVTSAGAVLTIIPGAVVAWGDNSQGQRNVPANLNGITAISAGSGHVVALKKDGTLAAWGGNTYGQTTVPVGLGVVKAVAAGGVHTVALQNNGAVAAWGYNFPGPGVTTVPIAAQSGVTAIAAGYLHSAALKSDGTVVAWGTNDFGQTTVPVAAQSGVTAIGAGDFHTVALKTNGSVVAWGYNGFGQTTVPVAAQSGVIAIAAGANHTVALKSNGTVTAWGNNGNGQTTVPVGLSGVTAIAAGGNHSLALKSDGTVVAWGANTSGQTTVPANLSGVAAIAAGYSYSLALVGTALPNAAFIISSPAWSRTNGFTHNPSFQIGTAYRVQASTNLVNWTDVTNFAATATSAQIRDAAATNMARRFYRVVSP